MYVGPYMTHLRIMGASPNYFGKDLTLAGGGGGVWLVTFSDVLNKKKWRPDSHNLVYQYGYEGGGGGGGVIMKRHLLQNSLETPPNCRAPPSRNPLPLITPKTHHISPPLRAPFDPTLHSPGRLPSPLAPPC